MQPPDLSPGASLTVSGTRSAWGSPYGRPGRACWACCEAKSAPGPSTQTQAASVNSSRLICSSGLFAFGEAPRAGGWESLEDTVWEFERALRGHLDLLLEASRDAKAQGGRGRRRLAGDG